MRRRARIYQGFPDFRRFTVVTTLSLEEHTLLRQMAENDRLPVAAFLRRLIWSEAWARGMVTDDPNDNDPWK